MTWPQSSCQPICQPRVRVVAVGPDSRAAGCTVTKEVDASATTHDAHGTPSIRLARPYANDDIGQRERDSATEDLVEQLRSGCNPSQEHWLRQHLIILNARTASQMSRRYRNRGESEEDLQQVALLALTEAAQRFDPAVASSFHSYYVPTVRGSLRQHFRDRAWSVRPPRRLQQLQTLARMTEADLLTHLGRTPSVRDVALRLSREVKEIEEAFLLLNCFSPARLDQRIEDADGGSTLGETLSAPDDHHDAVEARILLAPLLRDLTQRDKRMVRMRFFDGLTQREIAEEVGVTQVHVSRLLRRILSDLRNAIDTS